MDRYKWIDLAGSYQQPAAFRRSTPWQGWKNGQDGITRAV